MITVIAVAAVVRLIAFPRADELRDSDEIGYLQGSLLLLEGLPPSHAPAPAGFNTFTGWVYEAGATAAHVIHPGPQESKVPLQVRPFVALQHAEFDGYHDLGRLHVLWVGAQMVLALWAVWAAFWLGMKRGGPAGAVLVGGFVATVPLFVEFTAMARPYATAWYFGVLAMHAAIVRAGAARRWGAGIFLGLAVGSRVEMLALAPMLLWEFWNERDARPLIWTWISVAGLAVATALLSAPWLFTQLIANLRTIATVRFGPNPLGPTSLASALLWASWNQGMAILFVLAAIAPFVHRGPQRLRLLVLAAYVACGVLSMAGGTGTIYFDQQGVILLMVILLAAWAWPLWTGWPTRVSVSAACVILLLPLLQSVRVAIQLRQSYAPDGSAAWIEEHVRPGTLVYTDTPIHRLLPTAKCAQRLWAQVTDEAAWPRKFQSGLVRFSLPAFETPRVLSEASLVQERDIPRSYFILGGEQDLPEPRFDLMPYTNSVMYGIRDSDLVKDFKQTGGVVVWHPLYGAQPPSALGKPVVQWTSPDGNSICVFCSPDVRAHARNPF